MKLALRPGSKETLWIDVDGEGDGRGNFRRIEPGADVGSDVNLAISVDSEAQSRLTAEQGQGCRGRSPDLNTLGVGDTGGKSLTGLGDQLFVAA